MYIAHHPHVWMACELQYLALIVLVWHIIKSRTIEWIDHHGKGDVGIGGNAIADQPMPRWLLCAGISGKDGKHGRNDVSSVEAWTFRIPLTREALLQQHERTKFS